MLGGGRPWAVGVHHEPHVSGFQQVSVPTDQFRTGVVAAHVQNDGLFLVQKQGNQATHLCGRVGVLLLKVDGDARFFQQPFRITGAHQGLGLVKVEEVDFPSLSRQLQSQMDGKLGLSASGLPQKDDVILPQQIFPCHGIHLTV